MAIPVNSRDLAWLQAVMTRVTISERRDMYTGVDRVLRVDAM